MKNILASDRKVVRNELIKYFRKEVLIDIHNAISVTGATRNEVRYELNKLAKEGKLEILKLQGMTVWQKIEK